MRTWEHYKKAGKARRRCERNRYNNILKSNKMNSELKDIVDKIKDIISHYWSSKNEKA